MAVEHVDGEGEHWRRFGAWLRRERERRGLTRNIITARSGLSRSTVKVFEDGGRQTRGTWVPMNPSNRALYSLARALDVPPADVFARAGRPEPSGGGDDAEAFAPLPEAERLEELEQGLRALTAMVEEIRRGRA